MGRTFGVVLLWVGRAMILLAVFIVVSSFFLPDAVQPLNSVVCPEGLELSNAQYTPPNTPADPRLELVCTGPDGTESAAKKVGLVAVGLVAVGLGCIYVSSRRLHPKTRMPSGPPVV